MFSTSVDGKIGIITGGTSGYGLEMVFALKAAGAKIAVFSIDQATRETLHELDKIDTGEVQFFTVDLMQESVGRTIVQQTISAFGGLDFVIANAGFAIRYEKPLLNYPSEKVVEDLQTQFRIFPISLLSLSLEAAKVMREKYRHVTADETGHKSDSGSIIVTLSEAVLSNLRADLLVYAAAKKASQWIMENLAVSLAPYNIRVNGIAPGFANNEGQKAFYAKYPEIRRDVESLSHHKPSFMHPGSIVPSVMYLLTDNYVTGQTIALDGGYGLHTFSYFTDSDGE
jgi:NAD(P)-dependent dehydrogenase (short-subunit alcohol dehydrogenase family)